MRSLHRLPLPALLLLLVACSNTAPPVSTPTPAARAATDPQPPTPSPTLSTTCYFGPSTQTAADGTVRPGAEMLVRRTVDPEASTITEETVRFDAQAGVAPRRYTVVYAVDGDGFMLSEADGAFAGSGRFTAGEPWARTAWESSYRLPSGIAVESKRALTTGDDGRPVLTAERTAYGPDGGVALTLREELAAIDDAECERRFAALPSAD